MRRFSSMSTAPRIGNLIERNIDGISESIFLSKKDIDLYEDEPTIFKSLYKPCWINKKNLSLIGLNFLYARSVSLNEYYDEYNLHINRVLYTLRIHYISVGEGENILYNLSANFDVIIKSCNLFIHDVQNLINDYART